MALLGWKNAIENEALTLSASAAEANFLVSNLRIPIGAPSVGWQTPVGIVSDVNLVLSSTVNQPWRAVCLSRTNLSTSAQIRVQTGLATAFVEASTTFSTKPINTGWTSPFTTLRSHSPSTALATYVNSTGTWIEVGENTPRITHDPSTLLRQGWLIEPARTNVCTNPRAEGAVAGTPGTLPTGWNVTLPSGATRTVGSRGVTNGVEWVDLTFNGSNAGIILLRMVDWAGNANSVFWSSSAWIAATNNPNSLTVNLGADFDSAFNFIGSSVAANGTLQRFEKVCNPVGGGPNGARQIIRIDTPASSWSITIRVGWPQFLQNANFAGSMILPPTGSPQASTRGTETATAVMPANAGSVTLYSDFIISATTATVAETLTVGMRLTGDNNNLARVRGMGGSPGYVDATATLAGSGIRDGANSNISNDAVRREVLALTPSVFKRWFNGTSIDSLTGFALTPNELYITCGDALVYLRDIRLYGTLTDAQALQLSNSGSTLTASSYDSGFVSAGVTVGIGQAFHLLPAEQTAQAIQVTVTDTGNPDGYLNIPLAYVGPVWETALGVDSDTGLEVRRADTVARGGSVITEALSRARGWAIRMPYVLEEEAGFLDELEVYAAAGKNILFTPRVGIARTSAETVFGLCAPGRRGYTSGTGEFSNWSATIIERL